MELIAETEGEQAPATRWRRIVLWSFVCASSLGLFLLTFSPLLAGAIPFFVAGGPATCTGIWLLLSDPWKARGYVGLYFHLAMAGFRAAASGLASIVATLCIASHLGRQPDFAQLTIAMILLMCGCGISFVFGWIGTIMAGRNGVRIFVIANLFQVCRGEFSRIVFLPTHQYITNPANFVMAIALAVPMLAFWFALMLLTIPVNGDTRNLWIPVVLLCLLPVLGIACIVVLILLSNRIIARTPLECWGAPAPEETIRADNWYHRSE